jgi:short-subunit dehydrogenase
MSKKTIVVVGASRGIGNALVQLLASNPDHQIIALSRDLEKMKTAFHGMTNVVPMAFD